MIAPIEFDRDLRLTRSFKLSEFLVSSAHPQALAGISLYEAEILKFYYLCVFLLQPMRDLFGQIEITSAYRTEQLNELVGGEKSSQHVLAEAVDLLPMEAAADKVYRWACDEVKFPGEIILYPSQRRLHVALPRLNVKSDHFIKGEA